MKKAIVITGFLIMLVAQWFIPGNMIYQQESVIKEGSVYKFKTRPIDPTDPFRGKYITLNYELLSFETKDTIDWNEDVYVYLEKDEKGFAKVLELSKVPLGKHRDYVIAKSTGFYNGKQNFRLPFDRYYMEENKAYDAELAVRRAQRDTLSDNCYALVHIKGDIAVLSDVLIDEISIKEYVEKEVNNQKDAFPNSN